MMIDNIDLIKLFLLIFTLINFNILLTAQEEDDFEFESPYDSVTYDEKTGCRTLSTFFINDSLDLTFLGFDDTMNFKIGLEELGGYNQNLVFEPWENRSFDLIPPQGDSVYLAFVYSNHVGERSLYKYTNEGSNIIKINKKELVIDGEQASGTCTYFIKTYELKFALKSFNKVSESNKYVNRGENASLVWLPYFHYDVFLFRYKNTITGFAQFVESFDAYIFLEFERGISDRGRCH